MRLGSGSHRMCIVVDANKQVPISHHVDKEVAVKVIELKNNEDELHANFLKEEVTVLETIKGADPKNLLKLEKVIKSKNNLYIITEFC